MSGEGAPLDHDAIAALVPASVEIECHAGGQPHYWWLLAGGVSARGQRRNLTRVSTEAPDAAAGVRERLPLQTRSALTAVPLRSAPRPSLLARP